jgi:hypothetical protein
MLNRSMLLAFAALISTCLTTACNKSSPPPQEPVKPRGLVQIEMPLPLPVP